VTTAHDSLTEFSSFGHGVEVRQTAGWISKLGRCADSRLEHRARCRPSRPPQGERPL